MSRIRGPYVRFCERDEAVTPHPTRYFRWVGFGGAITQEPATALPDLMARPSPARLLLPALFLMTACGLPLVVLLLYNAPGGMLNAPVHDGLSPSEPIQPWTGWAGPFSELESFYAIRRSGPVRTVAASHF